MDRAQRRSSSLEFLSENCRRSQNFCRVIVHTQSWERKTEKNRSLFECDTNIHFFIILISRQHMKTDVWTCAIGKLFNSSIHFMLVTLRLLFFRLSNSTNSTDVIVIALSQCIVGQTLFRMIHDAFRQHFIQATVKLRDEPSADNPDRCNIIYDQPLMTLLPGWKPKEFNWWTPYGQKKVS